MTFFWTVDTTGHYWDTSLLSYSFWHFFSQTRHWLIMSHSIHIEQLDQCRDQAQSASTLAFFAWGWSSAFLFLGVSISITSFSTSSISSSSSRSITSLLWNKNACQSKSSVAAFHKHTLSFLVGIMEISSLSLTGVFNTEPLVLEAACNTITLKHQNPQISCM